MDDKRGAHLRCVRVSQAELIDLLIGKLGLPADVKLYKDRVGFVSYRC